MITWKIRIGRRWLSPLAAILVMPFLPCAFAYGAQPATTQAVDAGQPVTIARARQFDITSHVNGGTYRLLVYVPPKLPPGKLVPVTYVLDGNYYFATACDAAAMNQLAGIIVGVGYPSDDRDEETRRRSFDLSLPTSNPADKRHGGGDAFLRVVDEEVKPFIAARYPVDPARQALVGHSLGGLMVLRELFRHPEAFATYVAASPSIWWAGRAVLADEASFSQRARAGALHLRLLITSATDEQYHGDDPAQLARAQKNGMVSNASNLAARLAPLSPQTVVVTREILNDETHQSGSLASVVRGLRYTMEVPK